MIKAEFRYSDNQICGFTITGHSDWDEQGKDIVCAAVSSAAIMAANTVTEIQHIKADITDRDGFLQFDLSGSEARSAEAVLEGLRLHLTALSEECPQFINVKISEV